MHHERHQQLLHYRSLKEIHTGGAATIRSEGTIRAKTLHVFITGAGDADLTVDVDLLVIDMKEAGNLHVSGNAKRQHIVSRSSAGSLDNSDLKVGS